SAAQPAATPSSSSIPSISSSSTSTSRTAQASNCLYDILSLKNDSSNFQLWKYHVELILDLRGLWAIVEGSEKMP
ncbi:uncharacterized protein F5147DRAFT_523991, partial [Suillus discolor]